MKKHLYIVDMFRDVIQKVNEAFAGKFSDWTNINNLPIIDGMYRICYLNKSYQIISGLQVKDGDIIECRDSVCHLANAVHYNYGHPIEIANTLIETSKMEITRDKRFPLLALITDFSEKKDSPDYYCKASLYFLIANLTDPTLKADERTEINFRPVLHPIYEEFIRQIQRSKHFLIEYNQNVPHTQTDRYYWGRNGTFDNNVWGKTGIYGEEGNILNDKVDVIEISGLEIKVKNI